VLDNLSSEKLRSAVGETERLPYNPFVEPNSAYGSGMVAGAGRPAKENFGELVRYC
jgi:hypothetical protein